MLIDGTLHEGTNLRITQLRLRLALELWIADLRGNNRRQALTAIIASKLAVFFLHQLMRFRIVVHLRGQRSAEAFFVRTSLVRINRVGESMHGLVITAVPLQRDFHLVVLALGFKTDDRRVNRALRPIQVFNVINQAVRVAEFHLLDGFLIANRGLIFRVRIIERASSLAFFRECLQLQILGRHALVDKRDGQALVQESHFLQATLDGVEIKIDGLENLRIRPKTHRRTSAAGISALNEFFRHRALKVLIPVLAIALNRGFHARRQSIDDGNTHAVQTTGDRIRIGIELTAGVQLRHHNLHRGRARGMHRDRNTTAIVSNLHAAVGKQAHLHLGGITRHGLVDRVINNLPNQVVQAAHAGRTDIHTGALTDRFQALQDGN